MSEKTCSGCPFGSFYTVRKDDTLNAIAERCGTDIAELLGANPFLDPAYIEAGQRIVLPSALIVHELKERETLSDLLRRYDVSITELRRLNAELDLLELKEGDRVNIPKKLKSGDYVIKDGDTLAGMAHRFGISAASILRSNPQLKPDEFLPGQCIRLPDA